MEVTQVLSSPGYLNWNCLKLSSSSKNVLNNCQILLNFRENVHNDNYFHIPVSFGNLWNFHFKIVFVFSSSVYTIYKSIFCSTAFETYVYFFWHCSYRNAIEVKLPLTEKKMAWISLKFSNRTLFSLPVLKVLINKTEYNRKITKIAFDKISYETATLVSSNCNFQGTFLNFNTFLSKMLIFHFWFTQPRFVYVLKSTLIFLWNCL